MQRSGNEHGHGRTGHSHALDRSSSQRSLRIALGITAALLVVEVVGAALTGSLTLLADAGHMLSDVTSLGLALFALWFASRPHTSRQTYGYLRTEVLAALLNGLALWLVAGYVLFEAFRRFGDPPEVRGGLMLIVATAGFVANLASAYVLRRSAHGSLNVRAALLHVMGDLLGSVGAIVAGLAVVVFGWTLADPLVAVLIAALIMVSSVRLLRETVHVLLEGTPSDVDLPALERTLSTTPGVLEVHDLHAWIITSGYNAMSAHVIVDATAGGRRETVLRDLQGRVIDGFPIQHVTIQVEDSDQGCDEGHAVGGDRPGRRFT